MKKYLTILYILVFVAVVAYVILHNYKSTPSIVQGPSTPGCNQAETTTDCVKLAALLASSTPQSEYVSPATSYTQVASTSQSGKIDEHLTIDNTLEEVQFCGATYKTRQIFIDGSDVVKRISELASSSARMNAKDGDGRSLTGVLCSTLSLSMNTKGIVTTDDIQSFSGSGLNLPGKMYRIFLARTLSFVVNPATDTIYLVSDYDGSLGDSVGSLWKPYSNNLLGISFEYPDNSKTDASQWGSISGEAGKAFQVSISLPSGAVIYGYASTKDYTAPKDGFPVGSEGFVVRGDGTYSEITRGSATPVSFMPDDVWKLQDGSSVPVTYGKKYDPSADYPEPAARALVNLPGSTFTGIGFVLLNMDNAGAHPASPEDLALFKKLVTSVSFPSN